MFSRLLNQINESEWSQSIKKIEVTNICCIIIRLLHDTTLIPTALSITLLAIERLMSIFFVKKYHTHRQFIGVVINLFVVNFY